MTTPFFEYYRDDIYAILESRQRFLFSLNLSIIRLLAGLAGMGIVYLVIGAAALLPAGRSRESTFEKQAEPLAERLEWAEGKQVRLIFSDTGMRLAVGEDVSQEYPDDQLETAVETEHLLMLAVADQGVALQKNDLPGEELPALRRELARMKYTCLMADAG